MIFMQTAILAIFTLWLIAWGLWEQRKSKRLAKKVAEQKAINQQLTAEKAVIKKQVKHYRARKNNEENSRSLDRDRIINQLHATLDLRD